MSAKKAEARTRAVAALHPVKIDTGNGANSPVIHCPLSSLKPNHANPRVLRDERFAKLKQSLIDFPDMLNKRPIVAVTDTDGKFMVLGGNMRLRACLDLKMKEVPVILADEWTEEQRREFIIKDNVGFGEWDWDTLANEWDAGELDEWGLDWPKGFDGTDLADTAAAGSGSPQESTHTCPKCGFEYGS